MPSHGEQGGPPSASPRRAGEWRWLRTDTVLLAVGIGVLLWLTGQVLLMVFAGILLAVALDALAEPVQERTPLSRGWALVAVLIALTLLLVAGALALVPQFLAQLREIWEQLSEFAGRAQETLQQYPWVQEAVEGEQGEQGPQGVSPGDLLGRLAAATTAIFGALGTLFVIVVIGLFLAANPGLYRRGLVKLVPLHYRPRAEETLSTIGYALRWWLIGQLVSMLVLGTSTALGLLLFGVQLWLGLGLLTALLTFIPFLGPLIAGVPVVLISFAEGLQIGFMVLAFYLVLQTVEGYFVTPLIQQRAVDLPPALLISVQVLMGVLFGPMGLVLAAPLTAAGMVAVNLLYIEDVLGDRRATP